MSIFLVEWPPDLLIQLFDGKTELLGDVAQDRVNHFTTVVLLLTSHNIFGRHSALRQINIAWQASQFSILMPPRRMGRELGMLKSHLSPCPLS